MYTKVKERLKQILNKCDENTVAICGKELFYQINGETKSDFMHGWNDFFDDIVNDEEFATDVENMQLFITLKK